MLRADLFDMLNFALLFSTAAAFQGAATSMLQHAHAARVCNIEMAKKSVGDLSEAELKGKKVLVRCDLNVPLSGKDITDDTRIRASVPTVKYLMDKGAKVLLSSHLGRPKDGPEDKFSLGPVAPRLSELLGTEVVMAPDCIGEGVTECVDKMKDGSVLLLENTRFYKEEEKNVPEFAEKLAANADLFVNDAFGTAHRAHGSTEGVTKFLSPSVRFLVIPYYDTCASALLRFSPATFRPFWSRTKLHFCQPLPTPNAGRRLPAAERTGLPRRCCF